METTVTSQPQSFIAFYDAHAQAESDVVRLYEKGFDMKQFTIIAADLYTSEKALRYYNCTDAMKQWAISGAIYVGFWGLLFGFSTYQIPIIGPSLMQGWIGAIIAGIFMALVGAAVSAFFAALYCLTVRRPKKIKYETHVKAGKYMLLAQGTESQLEQIRDTLNQHIPKEIYKVKNWREKAANLQAQ